MSPRETTTQNSGLNAEQRAAVEHGDGPLLVVAGAGTGKTRVIIERIRNLLETNPELAGENILGLTFTDKAAGQMKSRVVKAIGERAEGVWLSTFHSFCIEQVLRSVNPDIQPLDDIDHKILLRRHIGELDLKHFRRLQDPGEFISDFVKFFSRCQDELVTPDDYQRYVETLRRKHDARRKSLESDALEIAEDEIARQEELARVYRVSERLLRERNQLTFGAQLMHTVQLLREDEALRRRMHEQYRYILVDEFQDTNIAQLELLWLLAGERRNIVAVGDDDQAIYRFRGASFGSFTIFLKRFCGVTDAKLGPAAKKFLVSLSQNYRSTQRILRVAGEVISHNEKSPLLPPKELTTENREGEKIRVAEFGMPEEEAHWITSEIERLHDAGARWRDFAVLYRKHTHREKLVDALRRREIPFVIRKLSISGKHAGARPLRMAAPDRRACGQRSLRARTGRSILGPRTARPGAPGGARRQESPASPERRTRNRAERSAVQSPRRKTQRTGCAAGAFAAKRATQFRHGSGGRTDRRLGRHAVAF